LVAGSTSRFEGTRESREIIDAGHEACRSVSIRIAMSFLDLAQKRRSVRRYEQRPVERAKLDRALEAARLAPSACNAQPWHFVVVDEPVLRARVAAETSGVLVRFNRFALEAPVIVVCIAEESAIVPRVGGALKNRRYSVMDVAIAAEHFCLQAAEEGVGTCMLGWFNEAPIKRLLGIPERCEVLLVIAVGYPRENQPARRGRKKIAKIRSFNGYLQSQSSLSVTRSAHGPTGKRSRPVWSTL
jgi:nitroreductase